MSNLPLRCFSSFTGEMFFFIAHGNLEACLLCLLKVLKLCLRVVFKKLRLVQVKYIIVRVSFRHQVLMLRRPRCV